MILSRKVRLLPNKRQEKIMWQSVGTARFVYNWTLNRQEENYKQGGKFIPDTELRRELTRLKKEELKWLSNVSVNVAKQAVKDACSAYKKFFTHQAKKPRLKSRKRSKNAYYHDNVTLQVKENRIVRLEKIGVMKTAEQLPLCTKYVNPRISNDGKYWYISIGIETKAEKIELTDVHLGIDVGVKELAVCSNGQVFKNINKTRRVRQLEKRLKRKQRQVSRKYQSNKQGNTFVKTNNIKKLEHQIKLIHRKLNNIRTNHLHQSSNLIVKTKPSRIVMEDLNVSGMMKNRHLAKAIAKQKLYEFKRQVEYKAKKFGIQFVLADRWYPSSKTCHACGHVKSDLKLKVRVYTCDCGYKNDRDLNASLNLSTYTC